MRKALHGEKVMVRAIEGDRRGKLEGTIVEVLQRNNETVLGHYHLDSGIGYVIPDDRSATEQAFIVAAENADVLIT